MKLELDDAQAGIILHTLRQRRANLESAMTAELQDRLQKGKNLRAYPPEFLESVTLHYRMEIDIIDGIIARMEVSK